jgi:hypothetical protein
VTQHGRDPFPALLGRHPSKYCDLVGAAPQPFPGVLVGVCSVPVDLPQHFQLLGLVGLRARTVDASQTMTSKCRLGFSVACPKPNVPVLAASSARQTRTAPGARSGA